MKILLCVMAGWLSIGLAGAAEAAHHDVCSARFTGMVPLQQQIAALRAPIDDAISTLDNTQIALPSPSLASGNLTYLNITPNFAGQLDKICVLGYFEFRRNDEKKALPLLVDHLEVVKTPSPHDDTKTIESTRIYFRTPAIEEFVDASDAPVAWKFWTRHQSLHLKIAAFAYADGQRGAAYFGRDERIAISSKSQSISAALLFAVVFYVIAGAGIPAGPARAPGVAGRRRWRGRLARLLPWNITGCNGQSSLSQLQMLVFTLIVATLLFYQWLRTGLLQEISTDLLYLIGISTAGAAGSQLASSVKKDLDPPIYRYVQELGWFTAPLADPNAKGHASGLLMTNKRFDIYKFQMLVFTFVIAAYVIASGANELGNIQISATLLTLMGMSQGAYIGGRAADSLTPLQDQLRGMQSLHERHDASTDPLVKAEMRRRFARAAEQAGAMFTNVFARVLPADMLEMPIESSEAPAS
ncbi:MAG: hypothetical protein ABIT83_27130 [Massilia sp.]